MSQHFPKPISKDININSSNYARKTDLKNINLGYFRGKSHFDGAQKYLVFQSILKYFTINNNTQVTKWKSKGLSNESVEDVSTSNNSLSPLLNNYIDKVRLKYNRSILQ